ncbi:peptidase inhibitor family I36 protein [Flindersiella endophytica]
MLKKILSIAGTLAVAGGFALATGPGIASADKGDCPVGAFCAWYNTPYEGTMYHKYVNGTWPEPVKNDDASWFNNGTPQAGADHVRVYDAAPSPDRMTLCIHQGASGYWGGEADDEADMNAAANKGNYHKWGGECRSSEPQLD